MNPKVIWGLSVPVKDGEFALADDTPPSVAPAP